MKSLTAGAFPYCVTNSKGDVLAVFKFSETARTCADSMNKAHGGAGDVFQVKMTSNIK